MARLYTVFCLTFMAIRLNGQPDLKFYDDSPDYSEYVRDNSANPVDSGGVELPVRSAQLERFMDALIMEAGRHFLYPPKEYSQRKTFDSHDASTRWDDTKGEPEYIDLGMKRSERQMIDCPDRCTKFNPVCANDGKVYDSECHLRMMNCRLTNVTVSDWEACRGKHYLCPSRCMFINDPVCGGDGRIYPNICVMRRNNCGQILPTRRIKFCYQRDQDAVDSQSCVEDCQEVYKPVCGSDGSVYYNECFLKMKNCGNNVEAVDLNSCTESPPCPERCLPIHDPVCGSDGKLYTNICRMLQNNCGIEIKRMPKRFCTKRRQNQMY